MILDQSRRRRGLIETPAHRLQLGGLLLKRRAERSDFFPLRFYLVMLLEEFGEQLYPVVLEWRAK
jgi:hypothetical protein